VEFQPSDWTRGSYLNVGAMWLWNHEEEPFLHYAVGGRVHELVRFESEGQFEPEARRLAIRAADEVARLRSLFPDIGSAASYLAAHVEDDSEAFDAAVASALAGDADRARSLFDHHDSLCRQYHERDRNEDWYGDELREEHEADLARSDAFRSRLDDPNEFRRHVDAAIARVREGLGLPPLH
jgi:hypothetical protein